MAPLWLLPAVLLLEGQAVKWTKDESWPAASPDTYLDPTAKLYKPTAMVFNPDTQGTVVLYRTTNTSFPPFMEFDKAGNIVRKWGAGLVAYAHDMSWEDSSSHAAHDGITFHNGKIWFTDTHAHTVENLDPASGEKVVKVLGHRFHEGHDIKPLLLSNVSHVAFSADDSSAFITDGDSLGSGNPDSNHRLVKLDPKTGAVAWVRGNNGTAKDNDEFEFCDPHYSSYDSRRDWIWVADRGHNRTAAFSAKDGSRTCANISTKPFGFAPNTVIVDDERQWLLLSGPPCDTHICTRNNGPFVNSPQGVLQSKTEGPSTFMVLDIRNPCQPRNVFGPMVLDHAGAHTIDFDKKTGNVYIDYLTGNALQRLKMTVEPEASMKTTWMNYSYVTSGFNLCNEATRICRSLGHWVFTVAPKSILSSVVTGAAFKVDDGPYVASKRGNFEAHFINGQCANGSDASSCVFYDDKTPPAQVWNIGYDVIQQGTASSLKLPQRICAKVWMQVPSTGEVAETEELCNDFVTTTVTVTPGPALTVPDMMYSQGADAVTYLCEDGSQYCRSDGHVSFDLQVSDPTHELVGQTEYSIDGGEFTSAKTNTFFEQKVKHQAGKWYHTISWNYDDVVPRTEPAPREICFRIAVQNMVELTTFQLDFGEYATKSDRHLRCLKFCNILAPFSYPTALGGYCPHKSEPEAEAVAFVV